MQPVPVKQRIGFIWVVLALVSLSCATTANETTQNADPMPRNVILFIADGGGVAHFTLGREFARYRGLRNALHLDAHQRGTVMTHSAKERVTDSASSATAFASGVKTYNGAIGMDTLRQSLPSVVDAAERLGKATGLVSSSRITHATPASFSAHVTNRWLEDEIADQQIRKEIDVLFGGGHRYYLPESAGGMREDGRDLLAEARELGYTVVTDYADLATIERTPVLGLFASNHLPYAIDRESGEYDLAMLTRKAIDLLSSDEDGFFLMVEGSRIDHAAHENDAAAVAHDVIDYDNAFGAALEFAQRDGRTLVIGVSDHETGGMSLGRSAIPDEVSDDDASSTTFWRSIHARGVYDWRPGVLADVRASSGEIASVLADESANVEAVMAELAGIDDLSDDEHAAIEQGREKDRLMYVVGEIIGRRAVIGWTTDGHTAADVNLYAFGPGSGPLHGNIDNSVIGTHIFDLLGMEPALITLGE